MDAIPSLCAISASCAIGAVGYALAQSKSIPLVEQAHRLSEDATPLYRSIPPTLSSTAGQSISLPKTRPVSSPPPSDPYKRSSILSGLEEEGESSSLAGKEQFSRPQTGRTHEEIHKRSSWYHRFSVVTPSIDGSVGSPSLQQPSTPSVFSNGSSATPFFGQPISTVTPPNKLVKRSLSYKGLPSEHLLDSTFASAGKGPTFRRPATSHQRSETLRLRNVQQTLAVFDEPLDYHSNTWPRNRNRADVAEDRSTIGKRLRPFFQYRRRRFIGDSGSKRGNSSKFFGGTDHITSVITPIGEHAILVLGNRVDPPKPEYFRSIDPLMEESANMEEHAEDFQTLDSPSKKGRHSISAETKPPTSMTWRLNRGSSLRKGKTQDSRISERRIVSAPLQSGRVQANENSSKAQDQFPPASPPSPLPKLETLSAFEIDVGQPSSFNQGGPEAQISLDSTGRGNDIGPASVFPKRQSSLRLKSTSGRGSRVPSDRSTAFGSDNENSRVFSVDGDDTDHRSETVYDSLRTEASGSSHSGARNYRVDHVFGEHKSVELVKTDLSTLQEKLSGVSLSYNEDSDFDEQNVPTSTWRSPPATKRSTANDHAVETGGSTDPNPTSYTHQMDIDSTDEESWDDELGIDSSARVIRSIQSQDTHLADVNTKSQKPNIFEWSESNSIERSGQGDADTRPKTSHPQQGIDRGGRPSGRRPTNGLHVRSQSVPLPPDNSKNKFNNAKKLDNWMLGNKGVSEDWDNDFEFEESTPEVASVVSEDINKNRPISGIVVPREILERQATVHGQFGQVKELTLLVEQLRRLYHSATVHGILDGQSSELWKEAAGIIDLATLDDEEPDGNRPLSPSSTNFDLDAFDDDSNPRRISNTYSSRDRNSLTNSLSSSPNDSRHGTPHNRPRHDSVARAKNVLANIHQHRDPLDPPLEIEEGSVSPTKAKKMPFDTTSLRDLVTRAGVVTRACKEIIRRIEDPDYVPHTPERRPTTPPDPPFFSQIFQNSLTPSTPSSNHRSPRAVEKVNFSTPSADHKIHGHKVSMMTVI